MQIRSTRGRLLLTLQAALFLFACDPLPKTPEWARKQGAQSAAEQPAETAATPEAPKTPAKSWDCTNNEWSWAPGPEAPITSVVRLARSPYVHPCPPTAASITPATLPVGLDWKDAVVPADNPITPEKAELGRMLFYDTRLSIDDSTACATCHDPNYQYTERSPRPIGVPGLFGKRRTPALINRAFSSAQFWDGRAASLEDQALQPVTNPMEMAFKSNDEMIARLRELEAYGPFFEAAFGDNAITQERVAKALATFIRTVVSADSPFDRWRAGDKEALQPDAIAGWELFRGKARCITCHGGANFTDEQFHNVGVGMNAKVPDLGRYEVTRNERDKGAFKTPSLRNVAERAPYLHNGSAATLKEVLALYITGGEANPWLSPLLAPVPLTEDEMRELLAFLKSLTGTLPHIAAPNTLPGGTWDKAHRK